VEASLMAALKIDYDDATHIYKLNGEVVPSVTQILEDTLPKPALTWWGFRVGMATTIELSKRGKLTWPALLNHEFREVVDNAPAPERTHYMPNDKGKKKPRTLIEQLAIMARLHPNAIKSDAATRGTSIHDALTLLAMDEMPEIDKYPAEDQPFVRGLCRWWLDHQPEFVAVEQIVASLTHRYAGRFDLLLRYPGSDDLVLADLKTGKDVRPDSHFRQLRGYEVAWREMGGEPIDRMQIINVQPSGHVKVETAHCPDSAWLTCVAQHRANQEFLAAQKSAKVQAELKEAA
jgi:hypothetical protein